MNDIATKACKTCREQKPITDFYKHQTNKDRLYTQCRSCEAVQRRHARLNRSPKQIGNETTRVHEYYEARPATILARLKRLVTRTS